MAWFTTKCNKTCGESKILLHKKKKRKQSKVNCGGQIKDRCSISLSLQGFVSAPAGGSASERAAGDRAALL